MGRVIPQDLGGRPVWVADVQSRDRLDGMQMPMTLQLAVATVSLLVVHPVVGQVCKHAGPAPSHLVIHDDTRNVALLRIALDRQAGIDDHITPTTPGSPDGEQVATLVCLWPTHSCGVSVRTSWSWSRSLSISAMNLLTLHSLLQLLFSSVTNYS